LVGCELLEQLAGCELLEQLAGCEFLEDLHRAQSDHGASLPNHLKTKRRFSQEG
jgi:hypothetical protein